MSRSNSNGHVFIITKIIWTNEKKPLMFKLCVLVPENPVLFDVLFDACDTPNTS